MFPALKRSLIPLSGLLVVAASLALQAPNAAIADLAGDASNDGVWFLDTYGSGVDCEDDGDLREVRLFGTGDVSHINEDSGQDGNLPVIQIGSDDDLIVCVEPSNDPNIDANVVFDTSGDGEWNEARCGNLNNDCVDEQGVGDDALTVTDGGGANDLSIIAVTFTCNSASIQTITIDQDDNDDDIEFRIMCKGRAENVDISATPTTVESDPAPFNTAFSLIRVVITDGAGNPVLPGTEVDFSVDRCSISTTNVSTLDERNEVLFNDGAFGGNAEFGIQPLLNYEDINEFVNAGDPQFDQTASMEAIEIDTNAAPDNPEDEADGVPNHSEALAILNAEGCDPGPVVVSVSVDDGGPNAEGEITVNVVGPPAFITLVAAPIEVVCGEKSELTISATDALNQGVSDFTEIEVVTNFGGVLGGNGSTLTSSQPVNPLSSTTAILYDGSTTAFLLTSDKHVGPYEVLAAHRSFDVTIVNQVTVTCTEGVAPTITPPDTGTGEIRPPNTGDAGLAAGSTGGTLLTIAGATFVALALIARTRLGRN